MKKLLLLIITMQITLFAQTPTPYIPINSGDVVEDHVNYLEKKYYQLELSNTQTADIQLTDLDADIDLYVAINRKAAIRDNDCYSSNGGTTYEKCILTSTAPEGKKNNIIILVYGFKASNYKLKISTREGGESITEISDTPLSGHLKQGESAQYKFLGKKGKTYTTTLSNLSADADLRVKIGKKANLHSFDCKSTNGGTKTDECSVTLTKDATVFVHVNGYRTADYSIKTVLKINNNDNDKLIKKAKELCKNKSNIVENHYICSTEKDIVYIMNYVQLGYEDHFKVYRISINPNNEKVELTLDKSLLSISSAKFIKLENTSLVGIITAEDHADLLNYQNFYHKGKVLQMSLIYHDYADYSRIVGTAETINNGTQLRITYKIFDQQGDDGWVEYEDLYNIEDTSNIKKISHKKI